MLVNIMKLHCYHSYRIIYKFITLIQVYSYSDKCWLKYFNNLSNCHYVYVHRSDKLKITFRIIVFAMVLPNTNLTFCMKSPKPLLKQYYNFNTKKVIIKNN